MASYLLQVSYTPQAWATLLKHPQDRMQAIRPAIEGLGGKIVAGYFAFGEADLIAIIDMPNNVSAAAFAMAATAGGACAMLRTTPLMTIEEGTQAMSQAAKVGYKPPA